MHIIDEFKVGGAQTHLVTMLREFRSRDLLRHEVWGLFEDGPIAGAIRALGFPVRVLDLREHFERRRYDRVISLLRKAMRETRPTLVEAHLTWSRLLALPAAQLERVPRRIGFEHGDIYLNSPKFRVANFVGQAAAHRIIVCSRALGKWARRTHGFARRRVAVLHNCVDESRFSPEHADVREPGWPRERTLFCAIGTLGAGVDKRMDICIQAIAAAREQGAEVGLVICGDGPKRGALEQLIRALELTSSVSILGMRDDVPRVVASCDAFCHAAPFEPFGIVCLEAMASGLPVLVPDSGGIREAIVVGKTGWTYPVLDVAQLARHMARLDLDPQLRTRVGAEARRDVLRRFTVETYVDQLLAIWDLPLGDGAPS